MKELIDVLSKLLKKISIKYMSFIWVQLSSNIIVTGRSYLKQVLVILKFQNCVFMLCPYI